MNPSDVLLQEAAQRVVDRLTPSPSDAATYAQEVTSTFSLLRDPLWKLRPSQVFPGLSFLVGFTVDEVASEGPFWSDVTAIAVRRREDNWASFPHHVRCRRTDLRRRSKEFRAVLEHEFVHICQYMSGQKYPSLVAPCTPGASEAAAAQIWMELEAYLPQHALVDCGVAHRFGGVTLARWVLLRAFHPTLEDLAALTPLSSPEAWFRVVGEAFRLIRARLHEDNEELWKPVTTEFVDHLPKYAEEAWIRGHGRADYAAPQ